MSGAGRGLAEVKFSNSKEARFFPDHAAAPEMAVAASRMRFSESIIRGIGI